MEASTAYVNTNILINISLKNPIIPALRMQNLQGLWTMKEELWINQQLLEPMYSEKKIPRPPPRVSLLRKLPREESAVIFRHVLGCHQWEISGGTARLRFVHFRRYYPQRPRRTPLWTYLDRFAAIGTSPAPAFGSQPRSISGSNQAAAFRPPPPHNHFYHHHCDGSSRLLSRLQSHLHFALCISCAPLNFPGSAPIIGYFTFQAQTDKYSLLGALKIMLLFRFR